MTSVARVQRRGLRVEVGTFTQEQLDACARVLGRLAVEKALDLVALDRSDQLWSDVGNPHKEAPAGVSPPTEAKEQVI
jgi:hypothetical protein